MGIPRIRDLGPAVKRAALIDFIIASLAPPLVAAT